MLKVVGGKEQLIVPVEAEPAHIVLNRLDIFGIFSRRISIVHAEMTDSSRLFVRDTEVEANRLGMADMEIAVWFRWEAGDDPSGMFTGGAVGSHDLTDEVGARGRCRFSGHGRGGSLAMQMMKRAWFYHRIAGRRRGGRLSLNRLDLHFCGSIEQSILESKFMTRIQIVADHLKETGL